MKTMLQNQIRVCIMPLLLLLVFAAAGIAGTEQVNADVLIWHEVNMKPGDTYDVSKAEWNTTVFIKQAGDYTLKGESSSVRVLIECGGANLYLADGLNINCSGHSYTGSRTAAIWVKDNGGTVKLISKKGATATLEGYMCPAIRKEGTDTKLVFETEDPDDPGTIHANSGSTDGIRNPAAIGSKESDTGNITFNSGNVIAKIRGTNSCGAAIGGAERCDASNITVNGGHVEAYGSEEGAGIGAGAGGVFTGFYVNGGEVYAENQVNSLHIFEGAAIGGGNNDIDSDNKTPGNIGAKDFYIKGGKVTAVSHGPAAAIGGGTNSGCSNINIEGGTVNATCDSETAKYECYGAGIGGGYGYEVRTEVNISGGRVTAKGGPQAPGIGSQDSAKDYSGHDKNPDKGTFRISGGTIYAGCGSGARGDIGTRDSKILITGGNLHALSYAGDTLNGNGDTVHRVEISFDEVDKDGIAISAPVFKPNDYPYGMNDVVTLSGKLHAWLPNEDDMDLIRASLGDSSSKRVYAGTIPFSENEGTLYAATRITLVVDEKKPDEFGSALAVPGETSLEELIPPTISARGFKVKEYTPDGTYYATAGPDGTLFANNRPYTDNYGRWTYTATDELIFFADLKAITYYVKFDANVPKNASTKCSGTMQNEEITYNSATVLEENQYKLPGYEFDGWYLNPECTGYTFGNGQQIDTSNEQELAPDQDGATVTLYAKWKPKTYTITFKTGSGGSLMTHEQTAAFDTADRLDPVDSFKWAVDPAYSLLGWADADSGTFYDDGEDFCNLCKMDSAGNLQGKTLTADWRLSETITATVTQDGVPVDGMGDYLFLIKDGEQDPVGNVTFDPVSGKPGSYTYTPPSADNPLVAGEDYYLCFDPGDAHPEFSAMNELFTYGGAYAVSTVFDYYTVRIINDENPDGINWDPGIKSAFVSRAGGTLNPKTQLVVPDDEKLVLSADAKAGYHFDGYSVLGVTPGNENNDNNMEPNKVVQTITVRGTADIMAHSEANVYKVHFNENGSNVEGTMPDQDMVYGEPQNLFTNQFTRPGGKFLVWATNKDGSGNVYKDGDSVENLTTADGGKVDLFACWTMTKFNITYDLKGGQLPDGKTNEDHYYADTATFTLVNPVKEDYNFLGWTGTGLREPTETVTIKEGSVGNRKYAAVWTIKQFTVSFVDNGGTGIEEQVVPIHQKAKKPDDPTRDNFTFDGWYADREMKTPYDFDQEITEDTTLYAKWTINPGTLVAKMTSKGKKAMTISWLKVPGADGYDIFFSKCSKKKDSKAPSKLVKTIKGDSTLKWTKNKLKKGKAYKAYVRAYVLVNGEKQYVRSSPLVHAYTANGTKKITNAKKVTVKKATVTLKEGKTFQIKGKVKPVKKGKKVVPKTHVATMRYLSTDTKIASVTKGGKIKAKAAGSCTVYAYAHNGEYKKIAVTVQK